MPTDSSFSFSPRSLQSLIALGNLSLVESSTGYVADLELPPSPSWWPSLAGEVRPGRLLCWLATSYSQNGASG